MNQARNGGARRVCVLSGGVGAAKFLSGVVAAGAGEETAAVVNTGDDTSLYGLRICPDLDTITYTLSGRVNQQAGWGLAGETYGARQELQRLGDEAWFTLGDRDIGTHMYRTRRLAEGATLTQVTAEIAIGIPVALLPMTDGSVATRVTVELPRDGQPHEVVEIDFQEYFVKYRHAPRVVRIGYRGADRAEPTPEVVEALGAAELIVIAPSNPLLSIWPILSLPGLAELVASRRDRVVAVTPIIAGKAVKGPLEAILDSLMHQSDVATIASLYAPYASTLVIDTADAGRSAEVAAAGIEPLVTSTLMTGTRAAADLAGVVLEALWS